MKRIIPGIIALAALLSGCAKEIENQEPLSGGTHTVTFIAGAVETKTQVVEGEDAASYVWDSDDAAYLHIFENGVEATSVSLDLQNDGTTCTITAEFPDNPEATSFVYKGYYCNDVSNSGNLKVPDTQTLNASSYDPGADLLITRETEAFPVPPASITLTFGRVAVINKVTLRGMVKDELVKKITITGSEALAGSYAMATPTSEAQWYLLSKTLKLIGFEEDVVDSDGQFTFYFVSMPFEGTISISVTTDRNQYDKSIESTLTFEVGKMTRMSINLAGYGEGIHETGSYALVNSLSDFIDGADYLIVGFNGNDLKTYAMGAQTNNNRSAVEVNSPEVDVITLTNATKAYPIRIESTEGGYFLIDNCPGSDTFGQYLYNASYGNENYLRSTANPSYYCLWNISVNEGAAAIENIGNKACNKMFFNAGSGLFNDYASLGHNAPLALYVDIDFESELFDPLLGFDADMVELYWSDLQLFNEPYLDNNNGLEVFYYSSDENVALVNEAGEVTFVGSGQVKIMAFSKFTGYYKTGYAEYSVHLYDFPGESIDAPFTVADAISFIDGLPWLPSSKEYYIAGTVSSVTEEFSTEYGNATFYIEDKGVENGPRFEAYRVKYIGNKAWTEGDKQIEEGDDVVILCRFKIYVNDNEGTTEYTNDRGCLASHTKMSSYSVAKLSATEISFAGGSSIKLSILANVEWSAEIDNGAYFIINDSPTDLIAGNTDAEVTVVIPENEGGNTYTIIFMSEVVATPVVLTITQRPKTSVIWDDDFSGLNWTSTRALSSLSGSVVGYGGEYSALSRVYPITGKIKVGGSSASGSITTPVLDNISGDNADLTITLTAAGWKGKNAVLWVTASNGTVSPEGSVSIASEATMTGNEPSMTGQTYTWTVSGADRNTTITISSNVAVGIDDLHIVQEVE